MGIKTLKAFVFIILIIGAIITLLAGFYFLYPEVKVNIYGDNSFDNAQVFADNKLIANMTWDDKNNRSYAKDIRSLKLAFPFIAGGDLHMKVGTSNVEFKIVTADNRVFVKRYRNVEDVSYFTHNLEDFDLIKK